ncbi:MAG: hypothetical protein ACOC8N_06740 [Spirochaetota bacterium]
MFRCAACGAEITDRVTRRSECPACRASLHSCVNCRFYSPGRHNDCAEPQAEPVRDKRAANFCDYFAMATGGGRRGRGKSGPGAPGTSGGDARERFNRLFGD